MQPSLLTLDEEYLLTATLPDLQRGIAPLGPPVPAQPPLLGPWGSSSLQPPLASGVELLYPATTPDLRRGVTPLIAGPDFGCWVSPLSRTP